ENVLFLIWLEADALREGGIEQPERVRIALAPDLLQRPPPTLPGADRAPFADGIDDENGRVIEGASEEPGGRTALVVADVTDRRLEAVRAEVGRAVRAPYMVVLPSIEFARALEQRSLVPDDLLRFAPPAGRPDQIRMQMGIVLYSAVALGMGSKQDFAA